MTGRAGLSPLHVVGGKHLQVAQQGSLVEKRPAALLRVEQHPAEQLGNDRPGKCPLRHGWLTGSAVDDGFRPSTRSKNARNWVIKSSGGGSVML
jgi:hypothetical protein